VRSIAVFSPILSTILLSLVAALPALAQTKGDPELGAAIAARVCVACHAIDQPSPVPNTPRLAGLHATYLVKQMKDYREGRRTNVVMQGLAAGLTEEEITHLAAYYAAQETRPGTVTDDAVLERGRAIYVDGDPGNGVPACSGCHGDSGEGTRRFPRLAGQDVGYTLEQMRLYAAAERTNDRGLMQAIASRMNESDKLAVAQFVASLTVIEEEQ
jgi:cytochrome c553